MNADVEVQAQKDGQNHIIRRQKPNSCFYKLKLHPSNGVSATRTPKNQEHSAKNMTNHAFSQGKVPFEPCHMSKERNYLP